MPQVPRREAEVLGEGATSLLLLPVQGEGRPRLQQGLKGTGQTKRERRLGREEVGTGHQSSLECAEWLLNGSAAP